MPQFEVRKNTEFILVVDAEDEERALALAGVTEDEFWDQAVSPLEAEELGPDGLPLDNSEDEEEED